jgi:hypothetical protein
MTSLYQGLQLGIYRIDMATNPSGHGDAAHWIVHDLNHVGFDRQAPQAIEVI